MNSRRLIQKQHTLNKLAAALLCTLGAVHLPAQAQTSNEQTPAALKKVKVSATGLASNTENSQTLSAADIENTQARNLDDLVRYIPGLAIDDLGRFGSNGVNLRGLDGDRVAITVDGMSLGETLNPASNAPYEFFSSGRGGIDVDSLKAVEVVKGADSIAAGSGSLGGAVLFVTKDPADYLQAGNDTYAALKLGYSSAMEESSGTATLANRTGNWESMLVYTYRDGQERESYYSGSRPNIVGTAREIPDPLSYNNGNLLAKLYYNANDAHRFGLVVENFKSESQLDNQTRLSAAYLSRTSDDRIERERYGINYLWQAGLPAFDELEWRYDYQESYTLGHTLMLVPSGCPAGATSAAITPCNRSEHRDYEQQHHKTTLDFSKAANGHYLSYGATIEQKTLDYADVKTRYVGTTSEVGQNWPQLGSDFVPNTDIDAYAIYLRDRWITPNDKVTINAGVRVDRFEYSPNLGSAQYVDNSGTVGDVSFERATWQLGFNLQLAPEHSIWAQTGTGFRAPTVEDMYFSPTTTTAKDVAADTNVELWNRVANPNLKAETSRNVELGYRWQNEQALIGLSVYSNSFSNFIETTKGIRNSDTEYQTCTTQGVCTNFMGNEYTTLGNIGSATIEGAELESQWLITPGLHARLAYSWNQGESKEGEPLASIVPASGNLGLVYLSHTGRWGLEGHLTFSEGKKRSDAPSDVQTGMTRVPDDYFDKYGSSFQVFDLLGHYNITPKLKLQAGVYNLFDEEYIRWQRIRFVGQEQAAGGARGGISGDGIHRYTEPGRNYRVTVSYEF